MRLAAGQQTLHAHAVLRLLNFQGIGGAHRSDPVGVEQAGLEERQVAVVFNPLDGETACRQAERLDHVRREDALVGQVMYGHQTGRAAAPEAQIGRRQTCLPIVTVQHIRVPIERRGRSGEQGGNT
jgi:hypothetical protein